MAINYLFESSSINYSFAYDFIIIILLFLTNRMKRNYNNFKFNTVQPSTVFPTLNCSQSKSKLSAINKAKSKKIVIFEKQDDSLSFNCNSESQISILNNFFDQGLEREEIKHISNEKNNLEAKRNVQAKQQLKDNQQRYTQNTDFVKNQQKNNKISTKNAVALKLSFNPQSRIRIHSHSIQIVKKNFLQQQAFLVEGLSNSNGASDIDGQNVHAAQCHPFYNTLQPLSDVSQSPFTRFKIKSQPSSNNSQQREKCNEITSNKRYAINKLQFYQDMIRRQKVQLKINKYDKVSKEQDLKDQSNACHSIYTKLSKLDQENQLKMKQKELPIKSNRNGHSQQFNLGGIIIRRIDLSQSKKNEKQKITSYELSKIKKNIESKIAAHHLHKENRLKIR